MDLTLHGTDDQLEGYAMGRLPDSSVPALEEHLMACAACRQRLDQMEAFTLGMREALMEPVPATSMWFDFVRRPAFAFPAFGMAAMLVILGLTMSGGAKFLPAASLQLTAIRGEMPFAPPAKELDLTLMSADQLPSAGPFRVEVVNAAGTPQWSGLASGDAAGITVKVQRRLGPGDYFVRLYGPDKQILHEYGFHIR